MWRFYLAELAWRNPYLSELNWNFARNYLCGGGPIQELRAQCPAPSALEDLEADWWKNCQREADWCEQHGIRLSLLGDVDYPAEFVHLKNPPRAILYRGQPVWRYRPSLSVVGSRQPSSMSLAWMDLHLTEVLQSHPTVVVSGGARGIDQKAHAVSLRASCPTICLIPSGFRHIYPPSLESWFETIEAGGGAIMSPFSPSMKMYKAHFHYRNRLIAVLSSLVFVVEARRRSGSLLTARLALELGREVAILPQHPMIEGGLGTLDLLCEGAFPVRDAEDLALLIEQFLSVSRFSQ